MYSAFSKKTFKSSSTQQVGKFTTYFCVMQSALVCWKIFQQLHLWSKKSRKISRHPSLISFYNVNVFKKMCYRYFVVVMFAAYCNLLIFNLVYNIELKRTGTLPEAGNLKPKFWGSGGITRPPCENCARSFAKYKQNPGRKLQKMS